MAFEVAFLLFLGAVLVAGIIKIGKPLADAQAERVKFKYRDLGSPAQELLTKKAEYLEAEIMDLKARVKSLEEAAEFEAKEHAAEAGSEDLKIDVRKKVKE